MKAHTDVLSAQVKALRQFNRFYTQKSGVLDPYLGSAFSLTEVRVLYELAHQDGLSAKELSHELALDAGYLSRILRRFEAEGWLARTPSSADARQSLMKLTDAGHTAFEPLQQKSRDQAAALLSAMPSAARQDLIEAMAQIQRLLGTVRASTRTIVLRGLQPGDMGWVVQQHAEVYMREYHWNSEFESLVAGIASAFLKKFNPMWEKALIAELDGLRVGSAFVARKSRTTAQLRLVLLTPSARGLGLGARLTDECIAFARSKGYRKLVLWTHSCLTAARAIYAARGFQLTVSEAYHGFGQDLIGETWELRL